MRTLVAMMTLAIIVVSTVAVAEETPEWLKRLEFEAQLEQMRQRTAERNTQTENQIELNYQRALEVHRINEGEPKQAPVMRDRLPRVTPPTYGNGQ
jgi:hypothetical protein